MSKGKTYLGNGLLILISASIVSPYVGTYYHGYGGLTLILLFLVFLLINTPAGKFFFNSIKTAFQKNIFQLFLLLFYLGGIGLTSLRGGDDVDFYFQILLAILYFLFGLFLFTNEQYNKLAIISVLFFLLINIVFVGGSVNSETSTKDIYKEGTIAMGTSSFWGLLAIFFPLFLNEFIKQKKLLYKGGFLLILLLFLFKLFYSGFATPIALLFLNFVIIGVVYSALIFRQKKGFLKAFILFTIGSLILYYSFTGILYSDSAALTNVQWRFNNFIENPSGGGYSGIYKSESRFKLMKFSFDSFINNPFFGGEVISEHLITKVSPEVTLQRWMF